MHRRMGAAGVKLPLCEFLESFSVSALSCADHCVFDVTFTRVSGAFYVSCALRFCADGVEPLPLST